MAATAPVQQRTPSEGTPVTEKPDDRESLFQRLADWVSAAMGRPTNIIVWLILVLVWIFIFAFGGPYLAAGKWMPAWFTSTGFNFPLNLITTVAELFIGFLVAAASNRAERNLDTTLDAIASQGKQIRNVEDRLVEEMASNYALTQQVHELSVQIHTLVSGAVSGAAAAAAPHPE